MSDLIKPVPVKWGTSLRLVIGDEPSIDDALAGEPFSDGYGRILDMLLRKAGVQRYEVTLVTLIPYPLPERANRNEAIRAGMRDHLLPVLKARPWERIDLVGEEALRHVGQKKESLFTWRGSPIEINLAKLEEIYG